MRTRLSPRRIFAYGLGLLLLASGTAASVRSNFGASPVASIPCMLMLTVGMELGIATILWQSFLVFLQFLVLRREFSPWTLLQLITGFIFGYGNRIALAFLEVFPAPEALIYRAFFISISIVVGGFGLWLYSSANIINMPCEGIVKVISQKLNTPFHRIKIAFDVTSVAIAALCCLIFTHSLGSLGIGTISIAVLLGSMVGVYERFWGEKLRFWFDKTNQ